MAGSKTRRRYEQDRKISQAAQLRVDISAILTCYSRLAGADEERTLARVRALRSDLLDRSIALHHGRVDRRRLGRSGF